MEILQTEPRKTSPGYWSFIVAALLAIFYFATSVYIGSHRLLWIDEVSTVHVARLPHWTLIWQVLAQGADAMPPAYFIVVRLFDSLFGHTDVAVRLPSALAMTVGLLVTFDCARRLTDGLHGLIAFSLLTCSLLPYYGFEARSYGLYFMLAALSLWVWTHTKDEKKSSAVVFGAVLFLCVSLHYYAVLCLVPYAVWEILNWKPWRLPSPKMMGGLLGVFCALAVHRPLMQGARSTFPPGVKGLLSLDVLPAIFAQFFPDGLFLLALVMAWIALVGREDNITPVPRMQPGERVGWFFLLIPLAGYVLAQITDVLHARYLIATLPGIAVAFSCWLWRHFREARRVSAGVFLLLAAFGLARQVRQTRDPERWSPVRPATREVLALEEALRNDGKQFIAVCDWGVQMEAPMYSKHPEEYVLLVPEGTDMIRLIRPEMIFARYYPLQFWNLEDFKKHARETALIPPPRGAPIQHPAFLTALDYLKKAGFHIRTRFAQPLEVIYLE
jgi:hypothetical protein